MLITLLSAMLILLSFAGCSDEDMIIKFKPNEGDKYEAFCTLSSSVVTNDKEVMSMDMDMEMNIVYSEVSSDKIVSELTYGDLTGNMNLMGKTIDFSSPEYAEVMDNMKEMKITVTEDGKGNVLDVQTEGMDESNQNFDMSSYTNSVSGNFNLFNNTEFKEGEEVEFQLNKLLGESYATQLGIDDDVKIKIKPTKITDEVVEGEVSSESIKVDNSNMDIKCNFSIDRKTGICNEMNYDINMSMENGSTNTTSMKMTMKKA